MPAQWKKNFLRLPRHIMEKVEEIPNDEVVVAAAKRVPATDIRQGIYRHLGIVLNEDALAFEESVLPPASSGRWSATNLYGKEVKRKDLPMTSKTFAVESPNYGDASTYGTHISYFERDVYQVDFIPPKHIQIKISIIDEEIIDEERFFHFKFELDEVLSKNDRHFEDSLFYNMNILQENVGLSDVFASDAPLNDYRATIQVDWEIFPPGEREGDIRRILAGVRSRQAEHLVRERYDVLMRLRPTNIIRGTSGFQRYFGAQFTDDLVVFENIRYGNAIYLMYENWQELSRKSRLELLAGNREGFERIPHTTGWETQLRYLVKSHRDEMLD